MGTISTGKGRTLMGGEGVDFSGLSNEEITANQISAEFNLFDRETDKDNAVRFDNYVKRNIHVVKKLDDFHDKVLELKAYFLQDELPFHENHLKAKILLRSIVNVFQDLAKEFSSKQYDELVFLGSRYQTQNSTLDSIRKIVNEYQTHVRVNEILHSEQFEWVIKKHSVHDTSRAIRENLHLYNNDEMTLEDFATLISKEIQESNKKPKVHVYRGDYMQFGG